MIYIINQFYGQRREHLKRELAEYLFSCGFEVTVLTGKNGEKGLKKKEISSNISILRISNSSFDGGIVKKLISYITFVIGAFFRILFFEKGSIIVVSSQPFLVARCVTLLKKMKRFRVLYNIQDLFPDIMYSKNISKGTIVYRLMKRVQKKTIDNSDVVITISKSMADLVMTRYSVNASKLRIIENWGNTKIEEEIKRRKKPRNAKGKRLRLIYAGNLGISHEIDTIFECLELISNSNIKHDVEFRIIGFGYNYNILKSKCESRCFGFVHFYDPLSDDELANVFAESDLALIISTKTARGSMVPSKFYTCAMSGPVIFVGDEDDDPAQHIEKGQFGFVVPNGDSRKLFSILFDLIEDQTRIFDLRKNALLYYEHTLSSKRRLLEWFATIEEFKPERKQSVIDD